MDWQRLYEILTENGWAVYAPGKHTGPCTEPYIVLRLAGSQNIDGISSYFDLYELLLYVPYGRYSEVETTQKALKALMRTYRPIVAVYDDFDYTFNDDDVKGYQSSITYRVIKKG